MCGIAGLVNWGDSQTLARMTDIQAHRGPDDRGVFETCLPDGGWVGLGSRRLAILDLSPAGHMPMCNPGETLWITYNGEIYNYPQLRRELEARGYRFRSNGDTEAILYLYQECGPECVRRLNGMFALAIWDAPRGRLFLARDHFGIKPLYYGHQGRRFAFASEIKALLEIPDFPRRVNLPALHEYLTFLWVPGPQTMFDEILKLPGGHYAIFEDGQLQIEQYWDLTFPPAQHTFGASETQLADEVRARFARSVQSQMLSDVPLGAFLSAGLDSSAIVAMMAHAATEPVRTYTIGFAHKYRSGGVALDDTAVAERTAQHFGCKHTNIVVEPDVVDLLPRLVWHMDEPTADPALITAYLVTREARKTVTVLLSGVGGDELFAGYRKYYAANWARVYQRLPIGLRRRVLEPMLANLPTRYGASLSGTMRLVKKMARSASLAPHESFLMNSTYLDAAEKTHLYLPQRSAELNGGADPWHEHLAYFERIDHADSINQMLYLDTKVFMPSLNLNYNDKMSMASSVEARVPFLDWEFAQWVAWNVPPTMKLRGSFRPTTKYIFRKAMQGILPDEVFHQRKTGFGAPVDHWLTHDLKEMVSDLLSENRLRRRGYFEPAAVRELVDAHYSGRQDRSMQIWQLLTLELWAQAFLD